MFGANLRRLRKKKQMTQQELADHLGVSRQAVCLWEADKREIKSSILHKIVTVLKVNANEFVRSSGQGQKNVEFEFEDTQAKAVFVTGDFTNWDKRVPLRRDTSGLWRRRIGLQPGRYEYKFIVDGEWVTDPRNDRQVTNFAGTLNSVKEI